MKKKMFKYALTCMLFLLTIFSTPIVHAEKYTGQAIWPSEFISNIFIKKMKPDGYIKWQQAQFIRRSEDNNFVYCLQPYTDINNNLPYYDVIREDYEKVLGLSEEQWERISLLAYYGYQYNENGYNHNDKKWYAITQVMIWRTTNPESDIFFTSTLNGSRTNKFDSEMNELNQLVANHYKIPNFKNDITLPLGKTESLVDNNGVLNNFKIDEATNLEASISGNTLNIKATGIGEGVIKLKKTAKKYEVPPIVYVSDHSQNVMRVGSYDPVKMMMKVKIIGGKVIVSKLDVENRNNIPQGEASLGGAIYGIFKEDGTKVGTVTTKSDGTSESDFLPDLGRFYLLEEKASNGYMLDSNKYYFEITEDNLTPTVKVFEQVIRRDFEITKVYAADETKIMVPEVGVKFGIYNNKNKLIQELITDKQGIISFNLPYGVYTIKQLTSTFGHEKIKDFTIEVKETGNVIKKIIANKEITAKLKVVKIDEETNEIIPVKGITFKIKDLKDNKYICQDITYPSVSKLCEFKTDKNGILVTPNVLHAGNYELEEVDQKLDGYLWNKNKIKFTVGTDNNIKFDEKLGSIIEIKFPNKQVKGQIVIHKKGERFIAKDNKLNFIERNLYDVVYEITANEDIKINNHKYYSKGEVVDTIITDDEGKAYSKKLPLGKYSIREIENSLGHIKDKKIYNVELKYKDQYTEVVIDEKEMKNYLPKGKVIITKKDLLNNKIIPNTEFKIYLPFRELRLRNSSNEQQRLGKLIYTGKTNKDGQFIIDKLPVGEYILVESLPSEGYLPNEKYINFSITKDGEIVKLEIKNQPILGKLEFTKTDFTTSQPLPNTKIEIYNDKDELIYSDKTDDEGKITIKDIRYGKYYILEKEAPEGYILNEEKMPFEIKENGEIVKCQMTNEKIKGNLEFTKIDYSTSQPLPNTKIEIYNDKDELIYTGITNAEGKVIIKNIEYGKYYILEKEAPEGYILNEEKMPFEIKENGEIVKCQMTNEKIIEVPNTEKNSNYIIEISASLLCLVGIGVILYGRKKKNK